MKMSEAMALIKSSEKTNKKLNLPGKKPGFMVHFEKRSGPILSAGYFPDNHAGEKLIKTEEEAWSLANRFARATSDEYVNIYVVNQNWKPVPGYQTKGLRKY